MMRGMKVRGWLNIGPRVRGHIVTAAIAMRGMFDGATPAAAAYQPGEWIVWSPTGADEMVLVCVDVDVP